MTLCLLSTNPSARGLAFAFGSFQSFYVLDFLPSTSTSAISWTGTIQSWLLIIGGLISGPLFDLGYYTHLISIGSFLSVFGIMMLSLATEYYQILLSQGICTGLGFGLLYIPSLTIVSRSFVRKRALALGIATAGAPAGGVIYTLIFEQLLPRVGFAWTVRTIGSVMLGLFVAAGAMISFTADAAKSTPAQVPATRARKRQLFDTAALKDSPFWSYTLANFFLYLGYMSPATTLVRFVLFAAFYGGISGALVPLPPSVFPHICPDSSALGTWMGMAQSITSFAPLIGAPIAGALADLGSNGDEDLNFINVQLWRGILLVSGAVQLLGLWWLLWRFRGKKGLF
ncbi:major facilitator superfamily domain-containing protein [Aspergillus desertorum]